MSRAGDPPMTRPDNSRWRNNYFPRAIAAPPRPRQATWGETLRYVALPLAIVVLLCVPLGLLGGLAMLAWGLWG